MIDLSRTVRFCVNPPLAGQKRRYWPPDIIHNPFAGWPSMSGLGAFYEFEVICRGHADPRTGYLINISAIDKAVRDLAIPIIEHAFHQHPQDEPSQLLPRLLAVLQPALNGGIITIRWRLTPYYCLAMNANSLDRVLMSQQFEFSASHRLHVPALGEARNREIFGKCNNPNSHGHNYRVEVTASLSLREITQSPVPSPQSQFQSTFTLQTLEAIVDSAVIKRFDHRHLNLDTQEFATLNPSVENIAKVCYNLLHEPIAQTGAELVRVKVWETEKTSCTYPAGDS